MKNNKDGYIGFRIKKPLKAELIKEASKLKISLSKLIEMMILNKMNIQA